MTEKVYKQIGLNIKKYREQKRLTQENLADLINKSVNHIGKIEVAFSYPSISLLNEIAKALDIPLYYLFMFDNN